MTGQKMKGILLLFCSILACRGYLTAVDEWTLFKATHGKSYSSPEEELRRFNIYLENKQLIDEHNAMFENGLATYKLKMNHFGDMFEEEMNFYLNGINKRTEFHPHQTPLLWNSNLSFPMLKKLPSTVDWRKKGYVTPVKDQKTCGSCWAFSVTGVLEGQLFRKTGKLISLSEQDLIDCSSGGHGCVGGGVANSYHYIKKVGGLHSEEDYPYKAVDGPTCKHNKEKVAINISGYHILPEDDEHSLKVAVAQQGPISVQFSVTPHYKFKFYSSGVYSESDCDPTVLNHAVIVVGYGTTESGQEYWLLKNSWGAKWGDHGYMKIARNEGNMCGIARRATYPIVE